MLGIIGLKKMTHLGTHAKGRGVVGTVMIIIPN